ncbi:mesoderm posterior protein 1-like [Astyanax mexicanus]|uniref:Mesoderm posterior bHLH transcription factor 2 n=1 Tax=Astyanax mexicanus TaxID=7994 RepID=A0A8B9H781_ASTMX|nr:mesoderm posterior protein 1-like [Astyanax mexicanus]
MDSSSSSLLQLQDNSAFLLDCENLLDQSHNASDNGYYSACSSLSPASSTDSCCFSPPAIQHGSWQQNIPGNFLENLPEGFQFQSTSDQEDKKDKKSAKPARRTGRPRSKCPGVKRQSASEREKLRMRDLTKALHHLRGFLPPSVAPAGQTLTKIETLRLTIRYISHLSAQLEHSQPEVEAHENLPGFSGQTEAASSPAVPTVYQPENFSQASPPAQSLPTQEFLNMTSSYQNPECSLPPSPAQDYWFPQQQYSCYYGQC